MCIYNVSTFISLTFSDFTFQFNMKFIQVKSFFDFLHYTFDIVWFMFIQWLLLVTAILVQMTGYHLSIQPYTRYRTSAYVYEWKLFFNIKKIL